MNDLSFYSPVKIFAGREGCLDQQHYQFCQRIMMIGDPVVSQLPYYQQIRQMLAERIVCEFDQISPNPDAVTVNQAADLARSHSIDSIVAIGGGSTLDLAKLVSALAGRQESIELFISQSASFEARVLELILIPTTIGTGSEVTNVAVVTDKAIGKKIPLVHDALYGSRAIIDSKLTDTLPARLIASSGIDTLCHAVEAYWNIKANYFSDAMALTAIKLVLDHLLKAYKGDTESREVMGSAACIAGLAFNMTRTTVCHAVSYSLTATYGIEHGTACAMTLLPFIKFNLPVIKDKFDLAAHYCGLLNAENLVASIEDLVGQLNLPLSLRDHGITEDKIELIVDAALAVGSIHFNPCELKRDDLMQVLQAVY